MTEQIVNVIGAGLAGSEAAWQIAKRGVKVRLYEMRPVKQTPAHHTDKFAELVCSNSLRANTLTNAVGVIKEEMRMLDSVIMTAADKCSVPAGGALAVDRHEFAAYVTEAVKNHPLVEVIHEEVTEIPEGITVIATGPLTSEELAKAVLNGCIVVDGNPNEQVGSPKMPYYIPIGTEAQVVEEGVIRRSMSIVFLEPYEDGDETVTSITTLTANDPR